LIISFCVLLRYRGWFRDTGQGILVTSVRSTCVRGCLLCWARRYQRHGDRWSDAVTSGFIYIGRGLCRILVGMLAAVQTWAFHQALPANNTPSVRTCRNRLLVSYVTLRYVQRCVNSVIVC